MTNKSTARALVDDLVAAYNAKDLIGVGSVYDDDVELWSSLGESAQGREAVLAHIAQLFERLPDETMTPETVVTDGETVVVEFTSRGTTGKGPYELRFTEVLRVGDGRVKAIKTYIDPEDVAAVG